MLRPPDRATPPWSPALQPSVVASAPPVAAAVVRPGSGGPRPPTLMRSTSQSSQRSRRLSRGSVTLDLVSSSHSEDETHDLAGLLARHGLPASVAALFEAQEMGLAEFVTLSPGDLDELGIVDPAEQRRVLAAISEAKTAGAPVRSSRCEYVFISLTLACRGRPSARPCRGSWAPGRRVRATRRLNLVALLKLSIIRPIIKPPLKHTRHARLKSQTRYTHRRRRRLGCWGARRQARGLIRRRSQSW